MAHMAVWPPSISAKHPSFFLFVGLPKITRVSMFITFGICPKLPKALLPFYKEIFFFSWNICLSCSAIYLETLLSSFILNDCRVSRNNNNLSSSVSQLLCARFPLDRFLAILLSLVDWTLVNSGWLGRNAGSLIGRLWIDGPNKRAERVFPAIMGSIERDDGRMIVL